MEKLTAQRHEEKNTCWAAPVSRWSAWEPDETDGDPKMPEIAFIDANLRRRLNLFARMALKVAHDCAGDLSGIRIVFASRHGDLGRTTAMLFDLADKELLSPTTFSMSVLNACTGIYSIAKKELAPSTAVAAGETSFGHGLLEACLQLASEPSKPVLFVYADEPAPPVYGIQNADLTKPLAIGLLLDDTAQSEIVCETADNNHVLAPIPQAEAFMTCLKNKGAATWHGENKSWKWSWHDRTN